MTNTGRLILLLASVTVAGAASALTVHPWGTGRCPPADDTQSLLQPADSAYAEGAERVRVKESGTSSGYRYTFQNQPRPGVGDVLNVNGPLHLVARGRWFIIAPDEQVAATLTAIGPGPAPAGKAAASPRAYYLFLAGAPQGCEDCYVPLLVVPQALEEVSASGRDTTIVLITTYERDSIWKVERGLSLAGADVSLGDRTVRFRGRRYRYQEITPGEVLRLLEKPEGTVPIHRVMSIPDKKSMEDLIAAFRGGN